MNPTHTNPCIIGAPASAASSTNVDVFPASFAQKRLWFLSQLEPDSASYNTALAVRLRGALNREATVSSLNEIVRRHEVLRTTFDEVDGELVQVIAADRPIDLPVVDFSLKSPSQREALAAAAAQAEARRPFDLRGGPVMRVRLLKLRPQEHILVLTLHHIVCDGWSSQILAREFGALYEAFDAGLPSSLPPLPIQYADYAVWQRGWLQGSVIEERLAYWKEKLKGKLPVLDLPSDRPRQVIQSDRGARFPFSVSRDLVDRLHTLSRTQGATLFMTLLAAFQVLLMRYSGLDDFCLGTPVANRPKRETETLIGFFANTLVLRANLSGNPTFTDLLARVQETVLGAQAHQDLPFEQLVDALQPVRALSHTPLFQVMFALQTSLARSLAITSLEVRAMELDAGGAKFDLSLDMTEDETGLDCAFEYNQDLFDQVTVARMASHLKRLLEGIVDNPQDRLHELPMLTEKERRKILTEWNDTAAGTTEGQVARLFEEQVARSPQAVAVSCGEEALSYRDLNDRADRIARALSIAGVGCESIVAVLGDRSINYVALMIALWKRGGVYLPLDPGHPPSRWTSILETSQASMVLTTEAWASRTNDAIARLPEAGRPGILTVEACLSENPAPSGDGMAWPSSKLAYVIYTSGSTGIPKGAMVTEGGLINHLRSKVSMLRLGPSDVVAQTASQGFDISVWQLTAALLCGARTLIVPDETARDPEQLLRYADTQEVTVLETVPALLRGMLDSAAATGNEAPRLARLRWLLPTGETLPPALVRRWFERYRHVPLINAYGPAECADDVAMATITAPPDDTYAHSPIGKPIVNLRLYVVDDWLEPVPIGAVGELCVAGAGVGRGYLYDPARTAEAFVPDPFSGELGSRLYRTGDRVRHRSDGTMEFLGRRDHQVKIRGVRIELGEIESRLQAFPDVREAAAVVRQDHPGQKRLVAYVVPRDGTSYDSDVLIRSLREQLPEPMVPSAIVRLEMLPRSVNGKIDRQALPQPDQVAAREWTAPRTPTESQLAAVWAEVLGLERVGVHDNFFELGGDSILSLQVISRAKAQGLPLTPRDLFQHQTVAELAEATGNRIETGDSQSKPGIRAQRPTDSVRLETARRLYAEAEDVYPLTPLQQGLLFHSLYEPQSGVYIEQLSCLLRGHLDHAAFIDAWRMVIGRSTPLRTAFMWQELDNPMQVVLPGEAPPIIELDWRDLPESEQRQRLQEFLQEDRLTDFDLTRPPLMRLALIRIADDARYLIWTHHHIVLDGWCLPIILCDLFACYACSTGGPDPGKPQSQPYRDYVEWILSQDQTVAEQYWRKTLAGMTAPTPLPTDLAQNDVQPATGFGMHRLAISAARTSALQAYASKERITVNTLVQGAWALLLSRYSGEDDVLFGTTVSGRSADVPGIETMLGLFINTLPLRVAVPRDAILQTWLRGLLQQNAELRQYEHTSLAQIQSWSQIPRGGRLFNSLLVFDNHPTDQTLDDGGAGLTAHDVSLQGQTNYPLTVNVVPGDSLCFLLSYQQKQFSPEQVGRIAEHLDMVLGQLVEPSETRLSAIEVLGADERRLVLEGWNATRQKYSMDATVPELIYENVMRAPEATAVRFDEQALSYRELWTRSQALASELRRHGVGPDVLVGICTERSLELIVGLLGIWQAGGVYVPIDPKYPVDRISYMLADAAPPILLMQPALREQLPPFAGLYLELSAAAPVAQTPVLPPTPVRLQHLAYTIYTSGSTGRPKGAGNTHGGLLNRLQWMQEYFSLTRADRVLQKTPFGFDVSVWELFWPLMTGAELVLAQPDEHKDGVRLKERIVKQKITTLHFVPPMLQAFLETPGVQACAGTLRRVICSGEALTATVQQQCWTKLPGVALHNLYGPTEAAIDVTVWPCDQKAPADPVPIGRPIANTQIYLLDNRDEPVPIGVPGELYIGGVNVARGYHKRPALTAEKFVPDPFSAEPGRRLYRTGDLARYRADGAIEYLGRLDHQVKIRGVRIELGEIESCLHQHPAVQEAVVVAQESSAGSKRLVGYVVFRRGQETEGEAIRQWVGARLPEALIPSLVLSLAALPLTPHGKVDRKALPLPDMQTSRTQSYEEPVTESEHILAAIWAEVLGQPRVGRLDNFFELGGDSINTLQVLARAHQRGVKLTPKQLFEHPTVAAAAAVAVPIAVVAEETSHAEETEVGTRVDIELSDEDMSNLLEELK